MNIKINTKITKITVMIMLAILLLTTSASAQTMYVGDTYNYNGQSITLLGINAIHAPYSVNLNVAGYAYTIQDGTHIYASAIDSDIWISHTSLFSTVLLVVPPNQPTPTPGGGGTWTVTASKVENSWNFNACAGDAKGLFYLVTPNNQNKFSTYVTANTCVDFSLPVADMVAAGGEGTWTAAIFNENDMSMSQAYFAFIVNAQTLISVTSNPSGAAVFVNGGLTPAGITPFIYNTNGVSDLTFYFSKFGYRNATVTGHYTTSTTVHANLVQSAAEDYGNLYVNLLYIIIIGIVISYLYNTGALKTIAKNPLYLIPIVLILGVLYMLFLALSVAMGVIDSVTSAWEYFTTLGGLLK